MLQTIRDRATGWIAYLIVGLLIIPFALFGVNEYATRSSTQSVANVGDSEITTDSFQRGYQQQVQRLQSRLGPDFDINDLDEPTLKREVLSGQIDQLVVTETARRQGFRISDKQIQQAVLEIPAFQVDGVFNNDLYERYLGAQGLNPVAFQENMRSSLSTSQLRDGIVASAVVTPAEVAKIVALLEQKRDIAVLQLNPEKYREAVVLTPEQIEESFNADADSYQNPERIKLSFVELSLQSLAEQVKVDDQALRAAYEEQLEKYSKQEERAASHILVTVPSDATQFDEFEAFAKSLSDQIKSGEASYDDLVKKAEAGEIDGAEGGELGTITQGMLDPDFEKGLYALTKVGDVSEPVKSDFGFHIIRLEDLTTGTVKPFEEVQDEVKTELRQREAEGRYYELLDELQNVSYEQPDSLQPAADAIGLEIQSSDWLTRAGGEGIGEFPNLIEAGFSDTVRQQGQNSEVIELAPDRAVVVRELDYQAAAPQTLEQAREAVSAKLTAELAEEALQADLDKLQEAVNIAGADLAAIAEQFDAVYIESKSYGRGDPGIDSAVITAAFKLPIPKEGSVEYGEADLFNGGKAALILSKVQDGKLEDMDEIQRNAMAARWESQIGGQQFQGVLGSLREGLGVTIFEDRL